MNAVEIYDRVGDIALCVEILECLKKAWIAFFTFDALFFIA